MNFHFIDAPDLKTILNTKKYSMSLMNTYGIINTSKINLIPLFLTTSS